MRKLLIAAVLMLIAGDAIADDQVPAQAPHPAQVSWKAADWNFQDSTNVTRHPFQLWPGAWSLNLRSRRRFAISTASPVLVQGWYVTMSGAIHASNNGESLQSRPWAGAILPGRCWIFFQEVGDDLSGRDQYYFWRSAKSLLLRGWPLVQSVGLEPENWVTIGGVSGDASAAAIAGFQQALANPQSIGIMCGRVYDDDNFNLYDIDAAFIMDSFAVCDPFRQPRRAPFRDREDVLSARLESGMCAPPSAQQR